MLPLYFYFGGCYVAWLWTFSMVTHILSRIKENCLFGYFVSNYLLTIPNIYLDPDQPLKYIANRKNSWQIGLCKRLGK